MPCAGNDRAKMSKVKADSMASMLSICGFCAMPRMPKVRAKAVAAGAVALFPQGIGGFEKGQEVGVMDAGGFLQPM